MTIVDEEAPLSDDELTALALAADPDVPLDDDALSIWDLDRPVPSSDLPDWYMPLPTGGTRQQPTWCRVVAIVVIIAFLGIYAYGLCSTYGQIVFA